jgi:putative membrane protein
MGSTGSVTLWKIPGRRKRRTLRTPNAEHRTHFSGCKKITALLVILIFVQYAGGTCPRILQMTIFDLPPINASLNGLSTLLICGGWIFILRNRKRWHISCMITALVCSTAFLACYLTYHFGMVAAVGEGSVRFTAGGIVRPIYYAILITHLILAFTILPLVVLTLIPALRARFDRHRKMGKFTLPIWLYVSVTGVIVYFMLYQWFPSTHFQELKKRYEARAVANNQS